MLNDRMSKLIGQIYAGASDSRAWRSALDGLQSLTRSRFILVSAVDLRTGGYSDSLVHGADDGRFLDGMEEYRRHLYRDDPTLRFAVRHPGAGRVVLRELVDRDDAVPGDRAHAAWVRGVLGAGDSTVRYSAPRDDLILGVSVHAQAAAGQHDAAEMRAFGLLFPHMENAMRLAARRPLVDGDEPVVLLDRRGIVRATSEPARRLLDDRDGLWLHEGYLRTSRAGDQAMLDRALHAAIDALRRGGVGGEVALARPSCRRPLLLTIRALPRAAAPFAAFQAAAVVRIVDPEARWSANARRCQRWIALFGLTPAEARLTAALLEGEDNVRDTAATLGIAYNTARVQLASVFAKTGVRTQSALVRLLCRVEV